MAVVATPTYGGLPTPPATLSRSSSISSASGGRRIHLDFSFKLEAAKARALADLGRAAPRALRDSVASSPDYDRLASALLLHFTALFQREALARCMERARRQHLENYNPYAVATRLTELEAEAAQAWAALARPYSSLLLAHSTPDRPAMDAAFFEALLASVLGVLRQAFDRIAAPAPMLEATVGALFRGDAFNLNRRKHTAPRSVDTLTLEGIWAVRHERGANASLAAKRMAGLLEKPPALGMQAACLTCSPLVEGLVSSDNPLVARRPCRQPLLPQRAAHAAAPRRGPGSSAAAQEGDGGRGRATAAVRLRAAFTSVAVVKGASLGILTAPTAADIAAAAAASMRAAAATHSGSNPAGAGPGSSGSRPMGGALQQAASRLGGGAGTAAAGSPWAAAGRDNDLAASASAAAAWQATAGGARAGPGGGRGGGAGPPAGKQLSVDVNLQPAYCSGPGSLGAAHTPGSCRSSSGRFGGTPGGGRGSLVSAANAGILPELTGLPPDEAYTYLALLRRYLLHGPGLGLAACPGLTIGPAA